MDQRTTKIQTLITKVLVLKILIEKSLDFRPFMPASWLALNKASVALNSFSVFGRA